MQINKEAVQITIKLTADVGSTADAAGSLKSLASVISRPNCPAQLCPDGGKYLNVKDGRKYCFSHFVALKWRLVGGNR